MPESDIKTAAPSASDQDAGPFDSFESLRRAHLQLMHTPGSSQTAATGPEAIRTFIKRASATGAAIRELAERRAAQGILDYWSTELISAPGASAQAFSPLRLAEPDSASPRVTDEANPPAADLKLQALQERSQEIIRLIAAARLWKDSGKQRGYLLTGKALTEAAEYRRQDEDLADLIDASELGERQGLQRTIGIAGFVIVLLVGLLAVATWLWISESHTSEQLQQRSEQLQRKSEIAESEKGELVKALAEAKDALSKSRRNAEEADQLDRRLQAALTVMRTLLQQKVITSDSLPPDIAAQLKTAATITADITDKVDTQLPGYDPNFLGRALPLPVLTESTRATAFDAGQPIDYVHYSVVMNAKRRLAIFTASTFDRNDRIVVRRSPERFALDPRVPRSIQPEADWFKSSEIDMGHLTPREEISWGPPFRGDETAASRKLGEMINVFTNVTPQFDTFNRGVWSQLERWVLSNHNRDATRVIIFTGPVLAADDPVFAGVQMPRRFWKIAVSQKTEGARGLVADAFLIAQFEGNKKIGPKRFAPADFRVEVAEIELLTGLDFGTAIRDAETSEAATEQRQEARPNDTVYFQFAGMTREDALRISSRMKSLGWKIPGEERTPAAAGQNEVRYGAEADRKAAELLLSDLKAIGQSKVCCTKRNPAIKPNFLEIWLSR